MEDAKESSTDNGQLIMAKVKMPYISKFKETF